MTDMEIFRRECIARILFKDVYSEPLRSRQPKFPPATQTGSKKKPNSKNLQPLKLHLQPPRPLPAIRPTPLPMPMRPRVLTQAEIRRPARIHAHAHTLVLDAPEKPRHLPQLLPAVAVAGSRLMMMMTVVVVGVVVVVVGVGREPDPESVADALELDA